ncbi:glutathionylspermidine synthase family protein [Leptolyngbya sp. FACHB-711]|uniref:glutathionylspermidine synthase family protein n=1 Tax=unclassified Leptolyngbya TaxID=2650499 RepID=UPI00168973DC|nr:glutathionylspermidine synthase family protein [Leptolyngbya sp. FACHB-711]MBD1851464.1 glutathionylspermidine synthase family protein [Cyanobacteria bacterium FACHB-502]MBD2028284.1 glutathionylspermidine synthase family protein [Leptolyngbya sp. FACHB-711]
MKSLQDALSSQSKKQFFDRLSEEAYSNLPADVLTLFEGSDKDHRPYLVFDPLVVSSNFCQAIRKAAEEFWALSTSTAQIFQNLTDIEILEWGYPEDYVPQFLACNTPALEMRLDIAVNPIAFSQGQFQLSDFKVLEANAATPGFWAETFVFNTLIAEHFGYQCPNKHLGEVQTQDFVQYLKKAFPSYRHGKDVVYFSFPYAGAHEDILSFDARIGYFQQLGGKAKFLYTEDLVIETDIAKNVALKTPEGDVVQYLFLHYPNEWLVEDTGEMVSDHDFSTIPAARPWDYLQQLVLEHQLYRVPPIRSEVIQNKGFFAFLWEGVHSDRFDPDTQHWIKTLIPQTYCTYEEAKSHQLGQVWEKPIYGREGAGIVLWEDNEAVIDTYDPSFDDKDWYKNMLAVYQEDCPMPTYSFEDESLLLMFTVYLSSTGRATGIGCRAVPQSKRVIDAKQGLWIPVAL